MERVAVPTCIKCGGHTFELSLFTPLRETRKLQIVHCSDCGAPLGVIDPAAELQIERLQNGITAIHEGLKQIAKALPE
jgi:hypothetical protein